MKNQISLAVHDEKKSTHFGNLIDYKFLPTKQIHVPRESHIKGMLNQYVKHIPAGRTFKLMGYEGEPLSLTAPKPYTLLALTRDAIYRAVATLPIFKNVLPPMKNGHEFSLGSLPKVSRCLVIEIPHEGIKGAIYFSCNVKKRKCHIHALEVHHLCRHQQLGSILVQSAILVALLYGCNKIALIALLQAEEFYKNMGFKDKGSFLLDLRDPDSRIQFLQRVAKVAPGFNLTDLIDKVITKCVPSELPRARKPIESNHMIKNPNSDPTVRRCIPLYNALISKNALRAIKSSYKNDLYGLKDKSSNAKLSKINNFSRV